DPKITKIFHGADYDIVSLKRDFGFTIHRIFDTMIAAQATSHSRFGLNDLVQRYFGEVLDKRWQRHDWSSRPLQDAQLDYARKDSHFLPALRNLLLEQGEQVGRLAMFEEEFALLEQREWTGRAFDPDSCMRIKRATTLDPKARKVLRAVVSLREEIAQSKNRPPFKVWSNEACMKIALAGPNSGKELRECLGDGNHIVRRYAREVIAASRSGLQDTNPPPENPKPPARVNKAIPQFNRDDEPLLTALKKWRNKRCQSTGLGPGMILNNALLKDIAALKPRSAEQFLLLPDMRKWQRDESGEAVMEFIAEWLKKHPADAKPRPGRRRRRGGRRRGTGAGNDQAKTAPTKDE
ncbi:MAG: HRDC domain-containing protein, partial [Myxococcota bacterium]|nr:HRDC domain-containing protein [Myxococcota bacterium]